MTTKTLPDVSEEEAIARLGRLTEVLNDILQERERQGRLHGNQNTDYPMMYAILSEEVGEVAQALQVHYGVPGTKKTDKADLYTELIQVAAYAAKFAEQVKQDEIP